MFPTSSFSKGQNLFIMTVVCLCFSSVYILVLTPAQLWEIGKLLYLDDGVIDGGLQGLGHKVGQDHCYQGRQKVGDLSSQLKHHDHGGKWVADCSGQSCSTFCWEEEQREKLLLKCLCATVVPKTQLQHGRPTTSLASWGTSSNGDHTAWLSWPSAGLVQVPDGCGGEPSCRVGSLLAPPLLPMWRWLYTTWERVHLRKIGHCGCCLCWWGSSAGGSQLTCDGKGLFCRWPMGKCWPAGAHTEGPPPTIHRRLDGAWGPAVLLCQTPCLAQLPGDYRPIVVARPWLWWRRGCSNTLWRGSP